MSKIAQYLQEHILGEVTSSIDARSHLSTDASIFTLVPSVVVYPRSEQDVRKTIRFAWQLAERQRVIPITARGGGTDYSGAAIGSGIMLVFPAHMNRIVQLDAKTGTVIGEPGLNFGRLQQTLQTHERFLPPYPASLEYSTIGGAVANNAGGEKSYKYGTMKDYVKALRVVLSNGEVISTTRLSKRELGKKLGLTTFEGEIYRQVDALIEEHKELVGKFAPAVSKNAAGYNLQDIKHDNGSFDLTPLFVGSQGTLGIITEVTMTTEPYNPETTLVMASVDSVSALSEIVGECRDLPSIPSCVEMVDSQLLEFVDRLNPNQLQSSIQHPFPKYLLFIEFDDASRIVRKRSVKKLLKILEKHAVDHTVAETYSDQAKLWKIRQSSASLISHTENRLKPIPLIDDAVVPPNQLEPFVVGIKQLFADEKLQFALWGHVGDGNLHLLPFIDLSQLGERQRMQRLYDKFYELVRSLGGSTTGQYGDGRLRTPLLSALYGQGGYDLIVKLKKIFDPYDLMNPGVKVGATFEDAKQLLRSEYTLGHLHNHMPRN